MADTWVATDGLNRTLPGHAECGSPRTNRPIGMFYFLWHYKPQPHAIGVNGWYDITAYIAAHPWSNPNNPWADNSVFDQAVSGTWFYWSQPQLGYYKNQDEWVLRRHIAWLTHAGVDVLIFDYSNAVTYDSALTALCDTIGKMQLEGFQTNLKITFLTYYLSAQTVTTLYNNFYSKSKYPDLWFYWQGKPLILGFPNGNGTGDTPVSTTVSNFFTWRSSWANVESFQREWQWIDSSTPQDWGYDTRSDIPEQVPVTCGGWSTANIGRSYTNHTQPGYNNLHLPVGGTQDKGLFFEEQMHYSLKFDPQFLFITSWNEWIVNDWKAPQNGWPSMLGNPCPSNGFYFVDTYNQEYSRDLEPMKDSHGDNYYFQLVAQNRRRKGARPVSTSTALKTINLTGDYSDWSDVGPEFHDATGDTLARNYASSISALGTYVNTSGRNDFALLKAARDADYLYFYAECRSNLTTSAGSNWMVLFIDTDRDHATGWEGYDYAVNLQLPRTATTTTLSRNSTAVNAWSWAPLRSDIACKASGNKLMLRLPRTDLGLPNEPPAFDFHWADNFQTNDITDFAVNGDSAPDLRFNYRFQAAVGQPATLRQDDFDAGQQSWWDETWGIGSKWALTSATSYSSNSCAVANSANGTTNSMLITRFDTSLLESLRISFRYKLHSIADAKNVHVQYYAPTGWVTIGEISRDEFYPSGQTWGYNERQGVWMQFTDARAKAGGNEMFFHTGFAFRLNATSLSTALQSVWVDDFLATGVSALPSNQPPVMLSVSNRTVTAGQTLAITNAANDLDVPPQFLRWSLLVAPLNAVINPSNGVFTWRPAIAQSPSTNLISVRVTDNGTPNLSATQSFTVTVTLPAAPTLSNPSLSGGQLWLTVSGDTGPDYALQTATNLPANWVTLLTTNAPLLPFAFLDTTATNAKQFYRVLMGP